MPVTKNADQQFTRVPRSKAAARRFYDRLSTYYDLLAASSESKYTDAGLVKLALGEGESVLEIGFGTGQALVDLAHSAGSSGLVCGIDISIGMYRVARRRIQEADLGRRVALCLGDAQNLPYKDAQFDALFISFTLELFDTPEIPPLLADCRRVLKPQGRICVVALSKDEGLGPVGSLYEWLHTRFPTYLDCRPIPLKWILNQGGFQVVDAEQRSMWGLPVGIVLAEKQD